MEPAHPLSQLETEGETHSEPVWELPPISPPPRPRCRSCHRDDRPVFGSVCAWCRDRE